MHYSLFTYKITNSVAHSALPLLLTLKAPTTTAADDFHKYFFHCFSEKVRLDVSCESSARQRIHLKNQALFSLKDKSKQLKCRLLQFSFGTLRVNLLNLVHNESPVVKS